MLKFIESGKTKAAIDTFGAQLKSVAVDGEEFIWQGNPDIWAESAPVIFPICGGLKYNRYEYGGKQYEMPKHGFAKRREFSVAEQKEDEITFVLVSDDETLKSYPFSFEFYVKFALKDRKLNVEHKVINKGESEMYYSLGCHEGYYCPEGINGYRVEFEKKENLRANKVKGVLISDETYSVGEDTKELKLSDDYFSIDALVFASLKSRKVELLNENRKIEVEYKDFPYLLIWTKPKAPYVCIEPWAGLPDFENASGLLEEKFGINRLEKGESKTFCHKIKFGFRK